MTLPAGYVIAKLSDICLTITDGDHQAPPRSEQGVPFITISALKDGKVHLRKATRFVSFYYASALDDARKPRRGDILFSVTGSVGITALVEDESLFVFQRHIAILRPNLSCCEPRWISYFLASPETQRRAKTKATGTAQLTLSLGELRAFPVSLPSANEQRRIVAKLDALTARLSRARAELERVIVLTNRLRERARLTAYGSESAKKPLRSDDGQSAEKALSEIATVITGSTPPATAKEASFGNDLPFLKPTDLDAGYNVRNCREMLSAAGAEKARVVPPETTLVTCIGATISKTGFARVRCAFNQQINAIVPDQSKVNTKWLYWAVTSPQFRRKIIEGASATTIPIINKGRFQALTLHVPPMDKQLILVKSIETTFARADRLEAEATRALALLDRLEAALLARAFRGELVPQDASDEPAGVLLDRIRVRRAAPLRPARGRRAAPAGG